MTEKIMLYIIAIPFIAAILVLLAPKGQGKIKGFLALAATFINMALAIFLYSKNATYTIPWAGFGMDFSLRLYHFSGFIIAAAAVFGFLIALYSTIFMKGKNSYTQFYAYLLISLSFVNGAVLADNLVLMLFFWEGLLLTMFGMIAIGRREAFGTATKAFTIVGMSDLCMMVGIALTAYLAGTLTISKINLGLDHWSGVAFTLLMIGAIAKSGAMPFHSWIPDAAIDAPTPFMAFMPASLEKLVGIYFLSRIAIDMFKLNTQSWVSTMLMTIGAITIILAVMMALVQKDYKRLLSYHAISQVGYMILGIGTALPVGIIGGIFHMINNAMYKCCLFLSGGSVEKQAGTTNLEKLGGLGMKMPVTFACFFIAAVSISGVPPFNGFFSKELIYDAALERGMIFYLAALIGSFLTAASFLKLGHACYIDKPRGDVKTVKEAPWAMLIPMIVIAAGCVVFGIYNKLPIKDMIQPIIGDRLEGHSFEGWPTNIMLVVLTVVVLLAAFANHMFGLKRGGSGLKAAEHIHHAPVLSKIYDMAEKRWFDPYNAAMKLFGIFAKIGWWCDKATDWIYNNLSVDLAANITRKIRGWHTGNYALYIGWSLAGAFVVILFLIYSI